MQASRTLHGHSSTPNFSALKLYTGQNFDPCDLQLKVKPASSSTLLESKGHQNHVMTLGRQNAFANFDAFVDFPNTVTALDVYKVNILLFLLLLLKLFF